MPLLPPDLLVLSASDPSDVLAALDRALGAVGPEGGPTPPSIIVLEAPLATRLPSEALIPQEDTRKSPFRILPALPPVPRALPEDGGPGPDPIEAVRARLAAHLAPSGLAAPVPAAPPVVLGPEGGLTPGEPTSRLLVLSALPDLPASLPPARLRVDVGADAFGGLAGLLSRLPAEVFDGLALVALVGLRPDDAALAALLGRAHAAPLLAWDPSPEACEAWQALGVPATTHLPAFASAAAATLDGATATGSEAGPEALLIATGPALAALGEATLGEAGLTFPPLPAALLASLAEELPADIRPQNPLIVAPRRSGPAAPGLAPAHHRHLAVAAQRALASGFPRVFVLTRDGDPLPPPASPGIRHLTPGTLAAETEGQSLAHALARRLALRPLTSAAPAMAPRVPERIEARLMAAALMRQRTLSGPDAVALVAALTGLPAGRATPVTTPGHARALAARALASGPVFLTLGPALTLRAEPSGQAASGPVPPAPVLSCETPEAAEAAFDALCEGLPEERRLAPRLLLTPPAAVRAEAPLRLGLTRARVAHRLTLDGRLAARIGVLAPHTASRPVPASLAAISEALATALLGLEALSEVHLALAWTPAGEAVLLDATLALLPLT